MSGLIWRYINVASLIAVSADAACSIKSTVIDLCDTNVFGGNNFFIDSARMAEGHHQCSCTLSTNEPNSIQMVEVTTTTSCRSYWYNATVSFGQDLDTFTHEYQNGSCVFPRVWGHVTYSSIPWSISITRRGDGPPRGGEGDPGVCMHVFSGDKTAFFVNCGNTSDATTSTVVETSSTTTTPTSTDLASTSTTATSTSIVSLSAATESMLTPTSSTSDAVISTSTATTSTSTAATLTSTATSPSAAATTTSAAATTTSTVTTSTSTATTSTLSSVTTSAAKTTTVTTSTSTATTSTSAAVTLTSTATSPTNTATSSHINGSDSVYTAPNTWTTAAPSTSSASTPTTLTRPASHEDVDNTLDSIAIGASLFGFILLILLVTLCIYIGCRRCKTYKKDEENMMYVTDNIYGHFNISRFSDPYQTTHRKCSMTTVISISDFETSGDDSRQ
ncbi:uncharacterized protein [Haliotis asinina]|uniref:uncharacterized protein n=1 Tax=Haliotis asinina TaxID=109174 RepID=UPI003531DC45